MVAVVVTDLVLFLFLLYQLPFRHAFKVENNGNDQKKEEESFRQVCVLKMITRVERESYC